MKCDRVVAPLIIALFFLGGSLVVLASPLPKAAGTTDDNSAIAALHPGALDDVAMQAAGGPSFEFVSQIGGATYAVAVQGDYAYIGEGPRLTILDISSPSSPTVVGRTDLLPEVVRGVAVVGGYAYIADYDDGLRVIDVSDPAHPAEVGHYDTPGHAYDVVVVGDYAYVADGGAGLRVVSVVTPTSPTEVGYHDTASVARGVAVVGGYAYIADYNDGLRVVSVVTPTSPTEWGITMQQALLWTWPWPGVTPTSPIITMACGW
jgi:hypothetical protein